MAEETEAWWTSNFPKYTLRNLNSMPIYSSFKSAKTYFSHSSNTRTEAYWTVDHCDIYEWFLSTTNKGEKIGYDSSGKTWFYELWTPEADHHLTVKTWLTAGAEWGVIIRRYAEKAVKERWSLDHGSKSYEVVEVDETRTTTRRVGYTPLADGFDQWTELTIETEDELRFERTWERPGSKGGENRTQRGSTRSGRIWFEKGSESEEKTWNTDIDREWGSVSGTKAGQHYMEKWDVEGTNRIDTKEYSEGGREWGSRSEVRGAHWRKEVWEGLRPVSGGVSYLASLTRNYEEAVSILLASESNIEKMVDAKTKPDLDDLKERRNSIEKPASYEPEDVIRAVWMIHGLLRDHEALKKTILTQSADSSELARSLKELTDLHRTHLEELVNSHTADGRLRDAESRLREQHARISGLAGSEALSQIVALLREQTALNRELSALLLTNGSGGDREVQKPSTQRELELTTHMDQLTRLILAADAVSSSLAVALHDSSVKPTLEALETDFDRIRSQFKSTHDPTSLSQAISLLQRFQTVSYQLAGGLHGLSPEQSEQRLQELIQSCLKLQREEVSSSPSVFETISEQLSECLKLAYKAIVGLMGDESVASFVSKAEHSDDALIPLTLNKLTALQELLTTLSQLEVNEENTETQSIQQDTKVETERDLAEAQVVRLTRDLRERESLLKEVTMELEELRAEHAANKNLSADLALAQAENQKLVKRLAELQSA